MMEIIIIIIIIIIKWNALSILLKTDAFKQATHFLNTQ